jgi:indole-3-glycerol phosphate synthase
VQKQGFDLPPVAFKRGGNGFDFDSDILNDQKKNIAKMNAMKEFDELEESLNKKGSQEETKSFQDLLREKRENTEKIIDSKNTGPTTESVEERKKRLQA